MAKQVKIPTDGKKPTIEDAAKALKESQKGEKKAGETETEDQDGKGTAGEQETGKETGGDDKEGEGGATGGEQKAGEAFEAEMKFNVPVPSDEECRKFAAFVCDTPGHLDSFRRTIKMVDEIMAERNKPAKKSPEEMAAANFEALVKQYGKDFVTAKKGTNNKYFSRLAWNAMGKNKNGWVEVTKVMPEVAAKNEA